MSRPEVEILPAAEMEKEVSAHRLETLSLYSQPWFLEAVAPSKGWFAKVKLQQQTAYFPFCGQRFLWKWRLFQPPFCQRFEPFSQQDEVASDLWQVWFRFLEENVWKGDWPFSISHSNTSNFNVKEKINYIFPLSESLEEMLGRWNSKSRNSFRKSEGLQVHKIDNLRFISLVQGFMSDGESLWRPTGKEFTLLQQVLQAGGSKGEAYAVFCKGKPLSVSLMFPWNGRYHYLFGISNSEGRSRESMPFFFRTFLEIKCGEKKTLDFEGSSLPGVAAFFRSLGGQPEMYGLWSM